MSDCPDFDRAMEADMRDHMIRETMIRNFIANAEGRTPEEIAANNLPLFLFGLPGEEDTPTFRATLADLMTDCIAEAPTPRVAGEIIIDTLMEHYRRIQEVA